MDSIELCASRHPVESSLDRLDRDSIESVEVRGPETFKNGRIGDRSGDRPDRFHSRGSQARRKKNLLKKSAATRQLLSPLRIRGSGARPLNCSLARGSKWSVRRPLLAFYYVQRTVCPSKKSLKEPFWEKMGAHEGRAHFIPKIRPLHVCAKAYSCCYAAASYHE